MKYFITILFLLSFVIAFAQSPKIRKTADDTNAGIRTVSYEIYNAENGSVLSSGTMSHVASMANNSTIREIMNNLLTEYLDANNISEPDGGFVTQTSGNTVVLTLAQNAATGSNTNPVDVTGLVFNYLANSKYRIWFMGRVQPGAATAGCGFQFDLSSAVTSISVEFFHQLANSGTLSGGHSIADDASVGVSSGFPGTSTYPVNGSGLLITGANTGTAQLRIRSETNAGVTAIEGFTLMVEKIE